MIIRKHTPAQQNNGNVVDRDKNILAKRPSNIVIVNTIVIHNTNLCTSPNVTPQQANYDVLQLQPAQLQPAQLQP
eukprot:7871429-Ditylum_brightwellii.AAC.1